MFITRHRNLYVSLVRLTAVATAMLMVTILIVTQSEAAFSDTTSNTGNSFSTGSVTLTDDDGGSTMFVAANVTPGVPVVECINVIYSGTNLPANIRMYGTSSGALAPLLNVTVEVGTGGGFGDCTLDAAPAPVQIFNDTLSTFSGTHGDWGTGLPVFGATAGPTTTRTLRFTVSVPDVPGAQSQSAGADFVFEAQD